MNEGDTHHKIMKTLQEYWKENQTWELKQTHTSGIRLRRLLGELRDLSIIRREEIQAVRSEKPKIKSPKYKAQIQQAEKGSGTN